MIILNDKSLSNLVFPINAENLEEMKNLSFHEVDKKTLVDIGEISVTENASVPEKVIEIVKQARNPFWLKCGDFTVKSIYQAEAPSITELGNRMLSV